MNNSECNKPCEIFSRITGYFRPVKLWNEGKKAEFKERKGLGGIEDLEIEVTKQVLIDKMMNKLKL